MTAQLETTLTRPRVEGDREVQVLEAALEVLGDVGYDRLTMDAVAQRAKASKATLYRRWNGKVALIIDALHHHHQHEAAPGSPDTGSLRGDLIESYCGRGRLTDQPEVTTFGAILTAVVRDPEFAAAFRRDVVAPKLAASRVIFERAIERGEVAPGVDIELLSSALAGIVMHRLVLLGEAPTEASVTAVIDQIILPAATAAGTTVPSHPESDTK